MRVVNRLLFWAAVLVAFDGRPLFGQAIDKAQKKESPINITADSLSASDSGEVIEAKGNVEIQREDTTIKAEEVRVNRKTQEVEAKGNVFIDDPQGTLRARSLRLNMEDETGEIEQGEIFMERNHLSASGRRFQKRTGQVYHIDEGFFTTCLCESGPPSWKISGQEIDLERDGQGVIKHGVFYLLDIPVFYIPYAVFPLRTERQTGFLFPRIGSSTRDGFTFQQPFFWAISKSSDATLTFDLESNSRIGFLGEYRTVLKQDSRAEINVSYYNESMRRNEEGDIVNRSIADPTIPQHRWSVLGFHRYSGPGQWLSYSDVAVFSDDLYTREMLDRYNVDYIEERTLRTSRFSRSRMGLFRAWKDIDFRGELGYYQDFIQPDERTFHRAPQVAVRGFQFSESFPLEFRWRAEAVNYVRERGADGMRLDLAPQVILPVPANRYAFGSLSIQPRETLYHLYETQGGFDKNKSRELVEIQGRLGTAVERIFSFNGAGLNKVKHVLEPEINYLFIPAVGQNDIPVMDAVDRIRRRNVLTFAVTNRFWGKAAQEPIAIPGDPDVELLTPPSGGVRDLGEFRMALSYDIDKERKGGDTLSDLDFNLRLQPFEALHVGLGMGLDPGPWNINQATAVFSLVDPRPILRRVPDRDFMRPNRVDLTYQFIRANFLTPLADEPNLVTTSCPPPDDCLLTREPRNPVGALGVGTLLHLTDHLLFRFNSSYDALSGRFTHHKGSLKILSQCECWTLMFSVGRNVNPAKTTFDFTFSLLGLGSPSRDLSR